MGKSNIMRILRNISPLRIMKHQKQLEIVEYLNYLGSKIKNDARSTRETKSRIIMTKLHSTRRRFFSQQIGLKEYSFILCLNLYTSESRSEITGKI